MVKVFLSHSSIDKERVRLLAADLRAAGVAVWLDEWQITVGDQISEKIEQGLGTADFLAVWLTRNAVESGWVGREWRSKYSEEIARRNKIILPLLAEPCDVPPLLLDKQYADFRSDYSRGLAQLLKVVVGSDSWENAIGMKFALIPPGIFLMGSERGEENERPTHQVTIRTPFFMGLYVVTQSQWRSLMGSAPWEALPNVKSGDNYPAVHVSWFDAQDFLNRICEIDHANAYYLPTEDEWEYAARAGTSTEFSFGEDDREFRAYGWYRDMTQRGEEFAHEVGAKKPNPWGLFDVHGNVWEWTDSTYFGSYAAKPALNPVEKTVRGGGWDYPAYGGRSAFRNHLLPSRTLNVLGFRLLCRRS